MALQPWSDTKRNDNHGLVVAPYVQVVMAEVPAGKIWVVEHISGQVAVQDGGTLNFIEATSHSEHGQVYLPVHFVSGVSRCGPDQGPGRHHQFGSPVTLYVPEGSSLVVSAGASTSGGDADSPAAISLYVSAVGHLVDA